MKLVTALSLLLLTVVCASQTNEMWRPTTPNHALQRELLEDDSAFIESCGWCCIDSTIVTIGTYEIRIFVVAISFVLLGMFLFLGTIVSANYLRLHQERQEEANRVHTHYPIKTTSSYATFDKSNASIQAPIAREPIPKTEKYVKKKKYSLIDNDFDQESIISSKKEPKERERDRRDPDRVNVYNLKNIATNKIIKPPKTNHNLRTFHFLYLLLAGGWFLLQCLIILLSGNPTDLQVIIDVFLYQGHALLDNTIIFAAFFPDDSKRNVLSAVVITVIVVALSNLSVLAYSLNLECALCSFFFPAPQAFYTYLIFVVMYATCLILLYSRSRFSPRTPITIWLWYMFALYSLALLGSGLVLFAELGAGICIINVVILLYAFGYAPLLYYTLRRDSFSLYWREATARANTLHTTSTLVARAHDVVERNSVGWIPYEEIVIGERLGFGAAGEVNQGFFLQTPVAIKRLFDNKSQTLEDFFNEVTLMSKLSHPNIVLFMGVCVRDNGDRYIITEMMNKGSVFDLIHPNLSFSAIRDPEADNELTPERIRQALIQAARGMAYLHSFQPAILHRDLKSHNLLVDSYWNIKIADFGLSRAQSLDTMTAAGTPQWSAPEVIRGDHYTTKADVYSFSIIIYELLSRKIPYANMGPLTAARQVAHDSLRPVFPEGCDPEYIALAQECWNEIPEDRPSFREVAKKLESMPPPLLPAYKKPLPPKK